jgi:5-methylcytosine-specific restriction endonuclease McrA
MRHPLCADCDRLAQCVHHVVPRHAAPERMYDESNLVSLCNACHEARHNHPNSKDLRH